MTPSNPQAIAREAAEHDHDWHKTEDSLPQVGVIVWVSIGGGTALLARYDYYRWISATSIKPLPFYPRYWQHLRLPESPGPLLK